MDAHQNRRTFLRTALTAAPLLVAPSAISFAATEPSEKKPEHKPENKTENKEEDVSPAEDLMREHGGLNRILLIYEEGVRRITSREDLDLEIIKSSAQIIRDFIEGYHEKLEEEFLFPRFRKAGKLVDLVNTLETQHKAGRQVTAKIWEHAKNSSLKNDSDKTALVDSLKAFIRMYRPHESREDTILFPAFHSMLTEKEYDQLGEQFEDREHKLFGKEGFECVVVKIEELEKKYQIYDLSKFTPTV